MGESSMHQMVGCDDSFAVTSITLLIVVYINIIVDLENKIVSTLHSFSCEFDKFRVDTTHNVMQAAR